MNLEEIFKKFEKKKLDWDKIVFTSEQIAVDSPKELIDAFNNYHVEMAGQAHSVALFKNVEEQDDTETYYLTPGSINTFYFVMADACERPDQNTVKIVSGSAAKNYEIFWDE